NTIVSWVTPVGDIFMNLIFMMVIPLILSALILGIAEIGDIKKLGRMGGRLLVYSVVVSAIAILIGITMVNLFTPGEAVSPETREYLLKEFGAEAAAAGAKVADRDEQTVGDILV